MKLIYFSKKDEYEDLQDEIRSLEKEVDGMRKTAKALEEIESSQRKEDDHYEPLLNNARDRLRELESDWLSLDNQLPHLFADETKRIQHNLRRLCMIHRRIGR